MSTINYSILPLLESDLPTLAQFVQESKLGLTINRLLFKDWPNEAAQRENYSKAMESNFADPDAERFKVVDNESGLVVVIRGGSCYGRGGGCGFHERAAMSQLGKC